MERLTYLAVVLGWAIPVIAVEWALAWRTLLEQRRPLAVAVAMATFYLGLADVAAVHDGIWVVAEDRSLPLSAGSFMLEDWVLILAVTVASAQAVVMAFDEELHERITRLLRRRRGG